MGDRIATAPTAVIDAIRNKLIDDGVYTDSTIIRRLNKENILTSPPRSTAFGVLVPGPFRFDLRAVAGGGREVTTSDWTVSLFVVAQLLLDQGDSDDQFLTNQTLGVLAKLAAVLDSLQLFDPIDEGEPTAGNLLLSQPMRVVSIGEGRKEPAKWGIFEVVWSVPFTWALS